MEKGRYIKTIYGREWKSSEQEVKENLIIVILGVFFVAVYLLLT